MNDFISVMKENVDASLYPKVDALQKELHEIVKTIIAKGYPPDDIGVRTEEIPMDDPEEEMRGGMTIVFTCNVNGEYYDIPDDLNYEDFVKSLK